MECDILDFSEYGNQADQRSDALLKKALEGCGAKVRVIRLAWQGITTSLVTRVWLRYDLRSIADLVYVASIAGALTESGHLVFPCAPSIRRSEDKWESYLAFKAAGLSTIDTFPMEELGQCRGRAVIKPRVGWGGMGMKVVSPRAMEAFPADTNGEYVYQPFVDHSRTWTVVVAGSESPVLLEKRAASGDFRTNSSFGKAAEIVDDSQGLGALAQRALGASGLVAGTVDLMEMDGRAVIVEVNSAPCLWYDELLDLDLAGPMSRTVTEWFDRTAACE